VNDIRTDNITKILYSTDASIHEVKPAAVAFPENAQDLENCLQYARQNQIPIIPRGAGTGITGGCLGEGLIVDFSLHMNNILSVDPHKLKAIVEPGVIQDRLNQMLKPYGMRLGPDTSTGDRATIGGMIANCAAGARSLHFGTMRDTVEEIELLLSTGDTVTFAPLEEDAWKEKLRLPNQEGAIYRAVEEIRTKYKDEIFRAFPKLPRRSSGYALDTLLDPFPLNLCKLITGSEGSLGIIKKATLALAPILKKPVIALLPFNSLEQAFLTAPKLLEHKPIALELIDDKIIEAGRNSPSLAGKLNWLKETPKALLIVEFEEEKLPNFSFPLLITDPIDMEKVWTLRKSGLGLLLSRRSYKRAIAFIEDLSIAPEHLNAFMQKFLALLKDQKLEAGIYGHIGPGCLHIRPYIDMRRGEEVERMKEIMLQVTNMIREEKGALSGEHGDGFIRSWLNEQLFGKPIVEAFQKIKQAFDPYGLMNPHKIVDPLPFPSHLRRSPVDDPKTFFSFKKEGGIALAADLCNGNGACRKQENVMCPSFQVTKEEYDSTRGRANTLRALLRGDLGEPSLASQELHDILDLCLECKGCRTECPSQVDMAKMKAEALYHYQMKHGKTLRSRIFAEIDRLNAWLFSFRKLYNAFLRSPFSWFMAKLLSLSSKPLPLFAEERFSILAAKMLQPEGTPVVLMSDTFTEFHCPETGIAAIHVLNKLGYQVTVPPWNCCGRTSISKGFLPEAKEKALRLTKQLLPYVTTHQAIIGLEPSCFFTFFDEYEDLIPESLQPLKEKLCYFDDFVSNQPKIPFQGKGRTVFVQFHCHQKTRSAHQLLQKISDLQVKEIPSGCCGMAGSFGHEREHETLSDAIYNSKIGTYLSDKDQRAPLIANGFSCRSQFKSHGRHAVHLSEFLQSLEVQ
jgi:FAD/FMN-containing dehydrogenase/Fe-S oxidoreductase